MAWGAGVVLALVVAVQGWRVAGWLVAAFALLCLEAARNAVLYGQTRQRVEDLERLSRASRRIAGSTSQAGFGMVAERIRIECSNVVAFRWFQFELLARESIYRTWWSGPDRALQEGIPLPPDHPPPQPGIHRRQSWLKVERTLETEEDLLGRLRLWCDPREADPQQVEMLDDLLPQMIASLQRTLLDLEAKQDPLTGLAVRRVLEERLLKAYRRSCQFGEPMAVIMCDLDHFKQVNDTFGHAAGDQALVATAELLLERVDEHHLAARYGGEEFTLLIEGADGDQALQLAETLRRSVEALELVVDGEILPLALSLGVAVFPELHVKKPQELVELADEALYEAKRSGRNRALLHVGRHSFKAIDGSVHRTQGGDDESPAPPPRIFA
jgi:diguanylate cyclase (GGDEF)-like protein